MIRISQYNIIRLFFYETEEMKNKITGLSNNDGVVGLCADMYDGGFDYWIGCKKKKFNKT